MKGEKKNGKKLKFTNLDCLLFVKYLSVLSTIVETNTFTFPKTSVKGNQKTKIFKKSECKALKKKFKSALEKTENGKEIEIEFTDNEYRHITDGMDEISVQALWLKKKLNIKNS